MRNEFSVSLVRQAFLLPTQRNQCPRIENAQIHANHVEAFNASLRRRNSAFWRKTSMYAKTRDNLQRTLDLQWLIHNFVWVHFTTKVIPAVKLEIWEVGLSWMELFSIRYAF